MAGTPSRTLTQVSAGERRTQDHEREDRYPQDTEKRASDMRVLRERVDEHAGQLSDQQDC